ncbi:MAG: glutamine synthetase family protein [Gammaproteobacteria bacterium]|nr:glutamine synthetase family protein [Gammaproteobacteria bacterium]
MVRDKQAAEQAESLFRQYPDISGITMFFSDLNGVPRGKRLPRDSFAKAAGGGIRMPVSSLCVDIWGTDVPEMAIETGDADGVCLPTERGLLPVLWTDPPGAYLPMSVYYDDHAPCPGDPRHALSRILERYRALKLTPVVAVELEFYLMEIRSGQRQPPSSPLTGQTLEFDGMHSVDELEHFVAFVDDVYAACEAQNVSADTALSEFGVGQFEINLKHVPDALRAADEAVLLKRIVRGIARKHGFAATFMAKPYTGMSGNGCHVHFSVLNENGANIFDNGAATGTTALRHAVAGLIAGMPDLMTVFAPHMNSYRRMRSESYAPTVPVWGYENRTTALRIPAGDPSAKRIEHRVAGADVNPYLTVAAVLGGALHGIENESMPPEPITGNAYASDTPPIPCGWQESLEVFEHSPVVKDLFDPLLIRMMLALKRQEMERFANQITEFELNSYLESV